MSSSGTKLRKKALTRKYVRDSLKKLQYSWKLCKNINEFDVICKELRINGDLTLSDEYKFREDRRGQGKTINSSNYTKNQKLEVAFLEECIKKQESFKEELLREKNELIAEIYRYQICMNCYSYNSRSPEHTNDVFMYNTYHIMR